MEVKVSSEPPLNQNSSGSVNQSSIQWEPDYDTAIRKSKEVGKPIFLRFTVLNDRHPNYEKVDQVSFNQQAFVDRTHDKFVFLNIKFPSLNRSEWSEDNKKLYQKHNQPLPYVSSEEQAEIYNFPSQVVIQHDGEFIWRVFGCKTCKIFTDTLLNGVFELPEKKKQTEMFGFDHEIKEQSLRVLDLLQREQFIIHQRYLS